MGPATSFKRVSYRDLCKNHIASYPPLFAASCGIVVSELHPLHSSFFRLSMLHSSLTATVVKCGLNSRFRHVMPEDWSCPLRCASK